MESVITNYVDEIVRERVAELKSWVANYLSELRGKAYQQTRKKVVEQTKEISSSARTKGSIVTRTKTQVAPDMQTFGEMLDQIDALAENLKLPAFPLFWLSKTEAEAVRQIGSYVPTPYEIEELDNPKLIDFDEPPLIASCAAADEIKGVDDKGETYLYPVCQVAFLLKTLPLLYEQITGTIYKYGFCYITGKKENEPDKELQQAWIVGYVVVKNNGDIVFPKEKEYVEVNVKKYYTYTTLKWKNQKFLEGETSGNRSPAENRKFYSNMFRQLMLWWLERDNKWSVGIRKEGVRITFSIAKEHTAYYFKDRNKTFNENGKTKKIIHYVKQHERANGSVVVEHLRGLDKFTWKDYECSVTAPKFNGEVLTTIRGIETKEIEYDEEDIDAPEGLLNIRQIAQRTADLEDRRL